MSNYWITIMIALIGVLTATVTAAFAFMGKNRENKVNSWDQLNEALQVDNKIWREEVSQLRVQLEAKILEITKLQLELEATKQALAYQVTQATNMVDAFDDATARRSARAAVGQPVSQRDEPAAT